MNSKISTSNWLEPEASSSYQLYFYIFLSFAIDLVNIESVSEYFFEQSVEIFKQNKVKFASRDWFQWKQFFFFHSQWAEFWLGICKRIQTHYLSLNVHTEPLHALRSRKQIYSKERWPCGAEWKIHFGIGHGARTEKFLILWKLFSLLCTFFEYDHQFWGSQTIS